MRQKETDDRVEEETYKGEGYDGLEAGHGWIWEGCKIHRDGRERVRVLCASLPQKARDLNCVRGFVGAERCNKLV